MPTFWPQSALIFGKTDSVLFSITSDIVDPYYEDLKYYAFIFLYTDGFYTRLGDFFAAIQDYKDARKEYSIDTNTFPSTLKPH